MPRSPWRKKASCRHSRLSTLRAYTCPSVPQYERRSLNFAAFVRSMSRFIMALPDMEEARRIRRWPLIPGPQNANKPVVYPSNQIKLAPAHRRELTVKELLGLDF